MLGYLVAIPVLFVLAIIIYEVYKYASTPSIAEVHPTVAAVDFSGFFTVVKSFCVGALAMIGYLCFN